jgi:hypothetical protein
MKNRTYVALVVIQLVITTGFSQDMVWHNVIAGQSEEYGNAIAIDNLGNVITTGSFRTICYGDGFALSSYGNSDIFLQKLSPNGAVIWVTQFGGVNSDIGHTVVTDSLGNIYVAGTFLGTVFFGTASLSSGTSSSNFFLLKLNPAGEIIWRKAIPGTISDKPKLAIDANDNLFLSGAFQGSRSFDGITLNSNNGRGYLAKINSDTANIIWATQFGSGTTLNGQPVVVNVTTTHIAVDNLGNIYVTGCFAGHGRFGTETFLSPNSLSNAYIAKINGQGVFQWTKLYTGTSEGTSIVVDSNNNIYTAGKYSGTVTINNTTYTTEPSIYWVYLEKFNANGDLVWIKNYNMNSSENSIVIPQLAIDSQANLFFKCHFYNTITFEGNTYNHLVSLNPNILKNQILATFSSGGANTWVNQYEGSNDHITFGLRPDKNTNIAITEAGLFFTSGSSRFNNVSYSLESGANIFTAKLTLPLLLSQPDFIKNDWVQVSPNPTNGRVDLDFKAVSSTVDILIYNAVGQKINQLKYQGMERIEIDLPSQNGVYLFDIRSDNQRVIKKVVKN